MEHPGTKLIGRKVAHAPTNTYGEIMGVDPIPFNTSRGDLPRVFVKYVGWTRPISETIASIERMLVVE